MPETNQEPSLYGIYHTNRTSLFGKNEFNSTFPAALCCYMRDNGRGAMLISQHGAETQIAETSFNEIFNTELPNDKLDFCFESVYEPYAGLVEDGMEKIDLVLKEHETGGFIRPLEVKLTTLPDKCTSTCPEDLYGSEIVVRPASMKYVALGLASRCTDEDRANIKSIFAPSCGDVQDWKNTPEMRGRKADIIAALDAFMQEYEQYQNPLVVQPVWKTVGQSPTLADNCLDVFVWTDLALVRCIYDQAVAAYGRTADKIDRHQRALLRLARFMYEFAKSGQVRQEPIYNGMVFGLQTDKEFAFNGKITNLYMKCGRLTSPAVTRSEIKNIIRNGGQAMLRPERRFDAVVYFDTSLFNEETESNGNG